MLKKAVQQVVSSCRWSTSASFSTTIKPQLVNVGEKQSKIVENISDSLARKTDNRLFAVVFAHNRQFKVSQNDLIQLHHNSILDIGQKIQLEKVCLFPNLCKENNNFVGVISWWKRLHVIW